VFLLERLRQRPFRGKLDDEVTVGWNAKDSILVAE
jgi:spermidine/putrescine transport system ATP-binding protein